MDKIDLHTKEELIHSLEEDLEAKLDGLVAHIAVKHRKKEPITSDLQQELVGTYLQYKAVSRISKKSSQDLLHSVERSLRSSSEKWSTKEKVMAGLYIILILSILALFINTYRFY